MSMGFSRLSADALICPDLRVVVSRVRAFSALVLAILCLHCVSASAQTPTAVPVLTWRYDLTHAGQNTNETLLTPSNVNPTSFGKLFSLSVDSTVYAQPVYVPNLTMSDGKVHNVLFVATENDSIYAFDADSNAGANVKPIWQISLLTAAHGAGGGETAVPYQDTGSPDVAPTIGITGTPTINPATNTMYVVAASKDVTASGTAVYYSRLHAINIISGAEQSGSPVNITATIAGTGNGSSGGQLTFAPLWENQRTALNYYNGYVYFGYSAHGDYGPWHGWLFAYNASNLQQSAALCLTPNDVGAAIWGSGAGLPIDTSIPGGRMFIVTGNGARTSPPFNANTEYGESVVAFNLANGQLTPTDEFTAFNYGELNDHDWDQGSGGLVMLPDQPGAHPHLLITAGKEGRITVLNRDNLGGYAAGASSNTNALQDIAGLMQEGQGFWGTGAYWNGHVYMWAGGEDNGTPNVGMIFNVVNGVVDTKPDSETTFTSGFPGPTFSISSNGTQDGIAWAVKSDQFNSWGPAVLYAFDANDLTDIYYESDTNGSRDTAGPATKYSVPVVTNGKVYFAARNQVDVYGLLNTPAAAAAPAITPNGGTFGAPQTITLASTTASASIYYTLDGSAPTSASTLYTGPISISKNTTVKAMATASGFSPSPVSTATFTFTTQAPAVSFSPAGGTYTGAQTVTLSDSDANASIYYTTNGATPSSSSTRYTAPIQVAVSETIKALAVDPSLASSDVGAQAYVIQSTSAAASFSLQSSQASAVAPGGAAHSTITITPANGFTGSVALTCVVTASPTGAADPPGCSISQTAAISGTQAVSSTLVVATHSGTTPGAYTVAVKGTSGSVSASTDVSITVTGSTAGPVFALSGEAIKIATPGMSGTSTITIAPTGGFTGAVTLSCALTSSPQSAVNPPTCSVSQPPAIAGTQSVTATLTVDTRNPNSAVLHELKTHTFGLGGGALAALLLFCFPPRRRRWQAMFCAVFLVALAGVVVGCGSGKALTPSKDQSGSSGNLSTTAGTYTITVTGTSGNQKATSAVTVTVD